jgi:hypothetical protein
LSRIGNLPIELGTPFELTTDRAAVTNDTYTLVGHPTVRAIRLSMLLSSGLALPSCAEIRDDAQATGATASITGGSSEPSDGDDDDHDPEDPSDDGGSPMSEDESAGDASSGDDAADDGPSFDLGSPGGSDDDSDGDGIPDDDDPFPDKPNQPGVALGNTVYAHSSNALYTMHVESYALEMVGAFQWPNDGGGHQMTDIAIDEHGVLYGLSFDRAYVCNPTSAKCFELATLPTEFNGLTVVPVGTVLADDEAIVGISNDGSWYHLQLEGMAILPAELGSYGGGHLSSGDAFSIAGVGTYASTTTADWQNDTDEIVQLDPATGEIEAVVGSTTGHTRIWGLAGWHDRIFAFDETGAVLRIDPVTGTVDVLAEEDVAWWGAGVRTVIPPAG